MKFNERVYDSDKTIVKTSSDIEIFEYPQYEVLGMGKLGSVNSETENVFIIENDIDLNVNIKFNTQPQTSNSKFIYYILPYDIENKVFINEGVYVSPISDFNQNITHIVNTNSLLGEGEYLFKLAHQYDTITDIGNKLGKREISSTFNPNLPYGNYDKAHDKYFIVIYKAEEPLLDVGLVTPSNNGEVVSDTLKITNLEVEHNVNVYALDIRTNNDILITWNGLVLTPDEDYTIENNVVTFFEALHRDDLVNLIYIGKSNVSGLKSNSVKVSSYIPSGETGKEGNNKIFYNTEHKRYELYTDYRVLNPTSFIVMLNGMVLANGVDYFLSNTNQKRVILNGDLRVGDIATVIYNSGENAIRSIINDYVDISWYVTRDILNDNGEFIVELATDSDFNNIEQSVRVPYQIGLNNYTKRLKLKYEYGQILYYRIRNVKRYETISGSNLDTENVSDIIRIEIKTNISNNY